MSGKNNQRKLQLAAGLLMLLAIVGVERMAVRPVGVYLLTETATRPFAAGMDKDRVLAQVNDIKSIREMMTCDPESRITLNTRKGFSLTREMTQGAVWTLMDRQQGIYWLRFDAGGRLDYLLFLNEPDREGQAPLMPLVCDPAFIRDPAGTVADRTDYEVFSR